MLNRRTSPSGKSGCGGRPSPRFSRSPIQIRPRSRASPPKSSRSGGQPVSPVPRCFRWRPASLAQVNVYAFSRNGETLLFLTRRAERARPVVPLRPSLPNRLLKRDGHAGHPPGLRRSQPDSKRFARILWGVEENCGRYDVELSHSCRFSRSDPKDPGYRRPIRPGDFRGFGFEVVKTDYWTRPGLTKQLDEILESQRDPQHPGSGSGGPFFSSSVGPGCANCMCSSSNREWGLSKSSTTSSAWITAGGARRRDTDLSLFCQNSSADDLGAVFSQILGQGVSSAPDSRARRGRGAASPAAPPAAASVRSAAGRARGGGDPGHHRQEPKLPYLSWPIVGLDRVQGSP